MAVHFAENTAWPLTNAFADKRSGFSVASQPFNDIAVSCFGIALPSVHKSAHILPIELLHMEMTAWYTKDFLTTALCAYLRRRGYVSQLKESSFGDKKVRVVLARKWGSRKIIEIKGDTANGRGAERAELLEKAFGDTASGWLQSTLFDSLVSLARSYKDAQLPVSLCLPDIDRYREMLTGVEAYFTGNNLHLEIFLVRQDGVVRTLNLNQADTPVIKKESHVTERA